MTDEIPIGHEYHVKVPFVKAPKDGKATANDRGYVEYHGYADTLNESLTCGETALEKAKEQIKKEFEGDDP